MTLNDTGVLLRVLSQSQVGRLLGVDLQVAFELSRGYVEGVPDVILRRAHFLVRIMDALAGSGLSAAGIALWLYQPHPELEGRVPVQAFQGDWRPEDPAPRLISRLAQARGRAVLAD